MLRFERRPDHPIEKAWKALTEPDLLAEWLAGADLELFEGGQVGPRWQGWHGYYWAGKTKQATTRSGVCKPEKESLPCWEVTSLKKVSGSTTRGCIRSQQSPCGVVVKWFYSHIVHLHQ